MIDGRIIGGLNAALNFAREGYGKFSIEPRDVADCLTFPAFWNAIGTHLPTGVTEMTNSFSRQGDLAECNMLVLLLAVVAPYGRE
jgi:L-2-hydroxyglutarate oxidase